MEITTFLRKCKVLHDLEIAKLSNCLIVYLLYFMSHVNIHMPFPLDVK